MVDDEEVPDPGTIMPLDPVVQEITEGTKFNNSHSGWTAVQTIVENGEKKRVGIVTAKTGDDHEKCTLHMRFTYTRDSTLHTPPGRHLPHNVASRLMEEIVDSWIADQLNLGCNLTEEAYNEALEALHNQITIRAHQIQTGLRNLPIMGFQISKRSSRRESPSYTAIPAKNDDGTITNMTGVRNDVEYRAFSAATSTTRRYTINNRPDTYFQKNTHYFAQAIERSVTIAAPGVYVESDRYKINHTVHYSGTTSSDATHASELVSEGSDTPVLLEEASVASESVSGASESWDLTLS